MSSLQVREKILEVASEYFDYGCGYFQQRVILTEVAKRLKIELDKGNDSEADLLSEFQQLFKDNVFAVGLNVYYTNLPFMRLTKIGAEILKKDRLMP